MTAGVQPAFREFACAAGALHLEEDKPGVNGGHQSEARPAVSPAGTLRPPPWIACAWGLAAVVVFLGAENLGLLRFRPGGHAYFPAEQLPFSIVMALAAIAGLKWRLAGGLLATMTAVAGMTFFGRQLAPLHASGFLAAFALPPFLFLSTSLRGRSRARVSAGAMAVAVAIGGSALYANKLYMDAFGPTHPDTALQELPDSDLHWIWSGAVTTSSASVVARLAVEADSVRLALSEDREFNTKRWLSPQGGRADGVARFALDSLRPATRYYYAVEVDGVLDEVRSGTFRTFPDGPASLRLVFGSCARMGTNGAVFDAIRAIEPDFVFILGDLHYANIVEDDPNKFRRVLDYQLSRTAFSAVFRAGPVGYVWDDHDFAAGDADSTAKSRPAAMAVYREFVPSYELAGPDSAIYQAFTIGRVRVIVTDTRAARSPSSARDDESKTMLGPEQKAWLKRELLSARDSYPVIIWVNPVPWIAAQDEGADHWGGYATERRELADFIAQERIDGLLMVSGDAHMVALDDGSNGRYSTAGDGGFPVLHAAALDRSGSTKGGPYSLGEFPGGGQFGLVSIADDGGPAIEIEMAGRNWKNEEIVSYRFPVVAGIGD